MNQYEKFELISAILESSDPNAAKDFLSILEVIQQTESEDVIEASLDELEMALQKALDFLEAKKFNRDIFRKKHPYEYKMLSAWFGSFKRLKQILEVTFTKKHVDRLDLNITKECPKSEYPKKILISALIPNMPIDENKIKSIETWCKLNNGDFKLLLMRGVHVSHKYSPEILERFSENIVTEYTFNKVLKARDFKIMPQMIIPLTGISRFGQKEFSVIVAAPKQFMGSVARGKGKHPHIIYTTGSINEGVYHDVRSGHIAEQDHTIGGLIVEIENDETFHIRNILFDSNNGFNDLNYYYNPKTRVKEDAEALCLGDTHYGIEDPISIEAAKSLAKLTNPKYIFFHDVCDNRSINHHDRNKPTEKWFRSDIQKTLESELNHLGKELKDWSIRFPKSKLMIVPSNHDAFIKTWLNYGDFVFDTDNALIGAELFIEVLKKRNPIESFLKKFKIPNITFLKVDEGFTLKGCELSIHGERGANGAKGSARSHEEGFGKCTVGHAHTPAIWRGVYVVGTNSMLNPDYAAGGTSGWIAADVLQFKNGMRQMVLKINGKYTLEV